MKTKFLLSILFILIFNFSFSQSDDDFNYAASDNKGNDYYVYIEKVNYSTKEIWIKKTDPIKTIKNKKGKYVKTGGGYTLSFLIVNCSDKEYDSKQTIKYNKSGDVVDSNDFPSYSNKVVPGSVMSGIFDFVCTD